MASDREPATNAVRALRAAGIAFEGHPYRYEEHGGTRVSARELGVDEHQVVKTLVMEDEQARPVLVLMHGDLEASTKALARHIGVKRVTPCSPRDAHRHTGYQVGGISPFGTLRRLPVYMEQTIAALPRMYVNGGRRGYLVSLDPQDALRLLDAELVAVGVRE
jgi:Cys-tRNA(Pro) deacylase